MGWVFPLIRCIFVPKSGYRRYHSPTKECTRYGYTGSGLLKLCKKAACFPIRDLLDKEKKGKLSGSRQKEPDDYQVQVAINELPKVVVSQIINVQSDSQDSRNSHLYTRILLSDLVFCNTLPRKSEYISWHIHLLTIEVTSFVKLVMTALKRVAKDAVGGGLDKSKLLLALLGTIGWVHSHDCL
ncbi:hypothetical protein V6N13_125524 [Hibiscus sabdariffa]